MRVLVTGAAGFIGAHVAAVLREAGAEVHGFDVRAAGMPDGVEPLVGDVLDADAVAHALAGCDAVFHLAAVYSYAPSDRAAMRAVNVEGTRVVLDACARRDGGRTRRVVHTSTCATCGPVPGRAATERDAPPRWERKVAYKATKLAGERLALDAAREGHDVVVVNPTTPVGPGDRGPTPTGRMVADVASGRARAHLAGGVLNVVAVRDVAASHLRAFERGRAGERYLLGGENLPIADVFAIIARAAGRRPPRMAVPWAAAYAGAAAAELARRSAGREPRLLVLDELRVARLPMAFDDTRARRELGHRSRPAVDALRAAASAFAGEPDAWTVRQDRA